MLAGEIVEIVSRAEHLVEVLTAVGAALAAKIIGWLVPFHLPALRGRN